jgi:hypothetical protein
VWAPRNFENWFVRARGGSSGIGFAMARKNNKSSRTNNRSGARNRPANKPTRKGVVWTSLLVSMTAVTGLLFALDRTPSSSDTGRAFTPLMAAVGTDSIEVVFNTRQPMPAGQWKAIVIHDSGSPYGTAETLDKQAKAQNLRGLGYHFVIGNGNGMGDGELYVGPRWLDQQPGAHATGKDGDWFNRNAIGICLVGDGERREHTQAELTRLVRLTRALQQELKIPANRVYLHSEIAPVRNPGRMFPAAAFRSQLISNP